MSPQPTNPRKCGTCGLEPRFCDCPDPVPAERRTGERRKRHGSPHERRPAFDAFADPVRTGPADRRSPGGAGLDSAVVGDALATAGWSEFRKKPVVVEAFHVTREALLAYYCDGESLPSGLKMGHASFHPERGRLHHWQGYVTTVHGQEARVEVGDWIVAEPVPGRFYPVKPDIFAATYEPADTAPPTANDPASPSTLAARSEPERRAELSLRDVAKMLASKGAKAIAAERVRQVTHEDWSEEHDDAHTDGQLAIAAAEMAADGIGNVGHGLQTDHCGSLAKYGRDGSKPDRARLLTIAGALIAAEIDRLARAEERSHEG